MNFLKIREGSGNKGFINFIVIVVVLILILSFLKVNLRGYLDTDSDSALRGNLSLIVEVTKIIWLDYIKRPLVSIWTDYVDPFFRGEFLNGLRAKQIQHNTLPPE